MPSLLLLHRQAVHGAWAAFHLSLLAAWAWCSLDQHTQHSFYRRHAGNQLRSATYARHCFRSISASTRAIDLQQAPCQRQKDGDASRRTELDQNLQKTGSDKALGIFYASSGSHRWHRGAMPAQPGWVVEQMRCGVRINQWGEHHYFLASMRERDAMPQVELKYLAVRTRVPCDAGIKSALLANQDPKGRPVPCKPAWAGHGQGRVHCPRCRRCQFLGFLPAHRGKGLGCQRGIAPASWMS